MGRLSAILVPLAALGGMAGCAGPQAAGISAAGDSAPYRGTWIVTDAFPAGAVADTASAPRGQPVPMEDGRAGDPAGRICLTPDYAEEQAALGSVLGAADSGWPGLGETVPVLTVRCGTQSFARYAMMGGGVLMTRYGGWVLRLEQGGKLAANPAPMVIDAAGIPAPAVPVAVPVPAEAAPRRLVYLASYKTEDWARKGWGILSARSATLKSAAPVTRTVDLGDKGRFVRLFAAAADGASAGAICKELGKAVAECGAAGRE